MDGEIGNAAVSSPLDQSTEMVHVAMNTPIGAEAEQMQRAPSLLGPFCQLLQRWGVSELIAAHRVANSHQLLADDAARTDGQVAHFRVAHLLIGQSHVGAAGLNQGVRIGMPEGIHHRRAALLDGVVLACLPVAPAIKNRENDRGNCPGAC